MAATPTYIVYQYRRIADGGRDSMERYRLEREGSDLIAKNASTLDQLIAATSDSRFLPETFRLRTLATPEIRHTPKHTEYRRPLDHEDLKRFHIGYTGFPPRHRKWERIDRES